MQLPSAAVFFVSRSNVFAMFLTLVLVGPAYADGLDDLITTMVTGQHQSSELKGKMDALTAQNERDKKEYDAYNSSFGQLAAEKKAKIDQFAESVQGQLKSADDMVEGWNSQCAEDRVGALPEAAYNACSARKAELAPVIERIRTAVKRDAEIYYKSKIAPIDAVQEKQRSEMDKIAARIKDRFATWDKLKVKYDALRVELEQVRLAVVDDCKAAKTIEEIKLCNAVGWDGAQQDLPPL